MKKTIPSKLILTLSAFVFCIIQINCGSPSPSGTPATPAVPTDEMEAHFINVGQADASLLEFPCGAILIDAGGEEGDTTQNHLINYLKAFFARRTDLHNTLDLVAITHDHIDHDYSLELIAKTFHIKNFVDNGQTAGSGEPIQGRMEKEADSLHTPHAAYTFEEVTASQNHAGLTDSIIDPIKCSITNPIIRVMSGRFQTKPMGWSNTDFKSNNNLHSLVIKINYGKSSFLFSGDLELLAIQQVLHYYTNTTALNADVWKVSHHGSNNGTTGPLLNAIKPKYAIISCGPWNYGINTPTGSFNTYNYGHPRIATINLLDSSITGNRTPLDSVVVFSGIRTKNSKVLITKNIYATPWDGDITIKANSAGVYTVLTHDK
jgi:competence protein ComEC